MRKFTLLILVVSFFGCKQPEKNIIQFSSQLDTLIIKTVKQKGTGLFMSGAGSATFRDTNDWKNLDWFDGYPDYKVIYPDNVEDLKLGFQYIMFDSLRFYNEKSKEIFWQKNLTLADQQILMITGIIDNNEVFIVDNNHNKDLRDDSIRAFREWDWSYNNNLILCKYSIDCGTNVYEDSSWFQIGLNNNQLYQSTAQHLIADFSIDDNKYRIGIIDENSSTFGFFKPVLCTLMDNGVNKDTVLIRDIVNYGEYVKLGKEYYKFHDLYDGCGTIVLTKENRFDTIIGTQIGMLAPNFKCSTIHNDTMSSDNLDWHKSLLIANFSRCTGRSYDKFKELNALLSDTINIIGLESGINKDIGGILIDVEIDYNKEFYKKYRDAYSSYDCYLIDTNKRIIDKFDIFDWEDYLTDFLPKDYVKKRNRE